MKLIQKLTLGFASVALILFIVGAVQFIFLYQIEDEVGEIAGSNVGEVESAIDITYRVAVIHADVNEYLLASINEYPEPEHTLSRKQQILYNIEQLAPVIAGLKAATRTGLAMAGNEDGDISALSEMAAIGDMEELIGEYVALVERSFDVDEVHGPQAATLVFLSHSQILKEQIRQASRALFTDTITEINDAVDEVGATVKTSVITTTVLSLGAFVVAILIGIIVSRDRKSNV